jgi:uncharacterized protein
MRQWIGFAALLAGLAVFAVPVLAPADAQDKKDVKKDAKKGEPKKGEAKATAGTVEIYKDKGGDYRFRIKDGDGKVIAMSPKGYAEKEDVVKLLDQIKATLNKVKPVEAKD